MAGQVPKDDRERHEAAFASSLADRDVTLQALHRLEAAAGTAAPGREADWLERVRADLRALSEAVEQEREESLQPDSLLSMIGRDYPRRFGGRLRQLRAEFDDVRAQIAALQDQLDSVEEEPADFAHIRERLGWLLRAVFNRRARETDLVYEAIHLDLGRPE